MKCTKCTHRYETLSEFLVRRLHTRRTPNRIHIAPLMINMMIPIWNITLLIGILLTYSEQRKIKKR